MPLNNYPIKRALLSVSDKTGIVEFATALNTMGVELLSTGGTAKLLKNHGLHVIEVSDYTNFPEMLDGRVKTLHPKIHAGILARRGQDDTTLQQHQIPTIDLVVVNLYPFAKVIAEPNCDLATAIENIDIGGPTMLRAAAKNYTAVTVVTDAADYQTILQEMQENNGTTNLATRLTLAQKVFALTSQYDSLIAEYLFKAQHKDAFPNYYTPRFIHKQSLRYGENPHQAAAFYIENNFQGTAIATAEQIQGKELSFNNIADADAALNCVLSFGDQPACVIVKHANPCGVAVGENILAAYQKAFACDPQSAFGGIIAFNRKLDQITAETLLAQQFVEVIVAPDIDPAAKKLLQQKPNVRVLIFTATVSLKSHDYDYKRVTGGLLIQTHDAGTIDSNELQVVSQQQPTPPQLQDLLFAWKVVKFVKSNAIVLVKDQATIGIGAGQMSRVDSVHIACTKAIRAGFSTQDAVMASDAFFPFRDSVDQAAAAGISAIIQPGGSLRDAEVIAAANELGVAMVLTGMRHFRH